MINPGQTIGVLGGGPLGRLLVRAAQNLGYRVHVYDPMPESAAAGVAERVVRGSFDYVPALKEFGRECAVITCAFEDLPAASLRALVSEVSLHPRPDVLETTQSRQRQKAWLRQHRFPHVRHVEALDGDVVSMIGQVGRPCLVKGADYSSEGSGQMKIVSDEDLEQAAAIFRGRRCILERWVDFSCELTVIIARSVTGETGVYPLSENIHTRGILDMSIAPARVSAAIAREAELVAVGIAEKLGVTGLLAVEFFVDSNGEVLVNEFAARPHLGGNWSIDGSETDQFEQHVRAICGLPLGAVDVLMPTVMIQVGVESWRQTAGSRREPAWNVLLGAPRTRLHVFGAPVTRTSGVLGCFTVRDPNVEVALERAKELKSRL